MEKTEIRKNRRIPTQFDNNFGGIINDTTVSKILHQIRAENCRNLQIFGKRLILSGKLSRGRVSKLGLR